MTLDSSKRAVERFVFETNVFRPFHDEQSNTNAHDSTLDAARVDKGKGKAVDEYDYQHEDDERLRDEDMDEDEDDEPLHKTRPEGWEKRHQMDSYNPSLAMYSRGAERQGARVNGTVILNTDLEAMLRAMLLKISICDSYLPPLGQGKEKAGRKKKRRKKKAFAKDTYFSIIIFLVCEDCSFTVLIEMKSSNTGPEEKVRKNGKLKRHRLLLLKNTQFR